MERPRSAASEALSFKDRVTVYIPMNLRPDDAELFAAELLDLVTCYLQPLPDGLPREDILEYFSDPALGKLNLLDFLRLRRFAALPRDFVETALKYVANPDGIQEMYRLSIDRRSFASEEELCKHLARKVAELTKPSARGSSQPAEPDVVFVTCRGIVTERRPPGHEPGKTGGRN